MIADRRKSDRLQRMRQPFTPGFLWGCATPAYQIEGSPLADGAGVSNWHGFVCTPGRVLGGDTGKDQPRAHDLRTHIAAVQDALRRGADLCGYCAWSLFDNLEWALGFAHVEFQALQRTPKASARHYARVIASHCIPLDD